MSKKRLIIATVIILVFTIALVDSLDLFSDAPYRKVPHGDHTHYMPYDPVPDLPLDAFPRQEPPPGYTVSPSGKIVPLPQEPSQN